MSGFWQASGFGADVPFAVMAMTVVCCVRAGVVPDLRRGGGAASRGLPDRGVVATFRSAVHEAGGLR